MKKNLTPNTVDYNVSVFLHNHLANLPIMNKIIFYLGVLPYQVIVYLGVMYSLFYMYLFQSFDTVQVIIFPFFFASAANVYLENTFFRRRPGCRFRRLSNTIDNSYCENENTFHSMPCRQTLLFTALATSIVYYLYDDNVPDSDKVFFTINMKKLRPFILSMFVFFISMTILERITNGYNYLGDNIVGLILGYIIGMTSYYICRSPYKTSFSDHIEWNIIRIIGCALTIVMMARFIIHTIPSKIYTKLRVIHKPRFHRRTASPKIF